MTLFRDLLLENPDTVYYKNNTYNYNTPANKCAFLVYEDEKSGKNTVFGYSAVKKEFISDDPQVLKDVDELDKAPDITYNGTRDQFDYWAQKALRQLKSGNNGGGHLQLENLLRGIGRFGVYADPILKGRIFEVNDAKDVVDDSDLKIENTIPNDKVIIVSFWTYAKLKLVLYKKQYEYVIEFNGYDPKEVLYEPGSKIYTYNELYAIEEPKKEPEPTTSITLQSTDRDDVDKYFKVGDRVKVKGMKTGGEVLSTDGDNVTIKITDTDVQGVNIGDEKTFSYYFLEPDTKSISNSLEKVIDDKTQEFVEKRGKLHTTGAAFTPAEKANLEREVDGLEIELKMLNNYLKNGGKTYTDELKNLVSRSVQRKLHDKEKQNQDRYSLIAQAEKQYGMPIAQIRQKYRGVPLDQLVKKESLYKKLLKSLRG